jgi:hypothetical protein
MIINRYLYTLGFLIVLISFSCNKPHRKNEIIKIELARSGGLNRNDPGTAISIDSSLNYKYYGVLNHNHFGKSDFPQPKYYEGLISEELWDTLNQKIERIKYKTLDTVDNGGVTDVNYFELIIHWRNGRKRITRIDTGGNYPVIKTLIWLNNSYKNIKLKQVNEPLKFETTYQIPPHSNLKPIKFPPPVN